MLDAFEKFGRVKSVTLKNYYAFVDFEDHEAAVKAVEEMNGKTFINGEVLTV